MLTYTTIMTYLEIGAPPSPTIAFARELADRFQAGLIGFAAAEAVPILPAGDGLVVDGKLLQHEIDEIENGLKSLRAQFEAETGGGLDTSWRSFMGNPTTLLATHARAADLVIVGAQSNSEFGSSRSLDLGSLILTCGRPVLVAADEPTPVTGQTIVVAWKDSREARRAVVDAIPFLIRARDVVVVAAVKDEHRKSAEDSVSDVVRFLLRHGVKARPEVVDAGDNSVGDELSEMLRETGADLIVSGGFGHSRLREWVFGGVTRSLLHDGSMHRLLSN